MNNLIVANWKMNPGSQKEAEVILKEVSLLAKSSKNINIAVCVPFPFLSIAKSKIKAKNIFIGAQDVSSEIEGAHTGEVSIKMLKDFGVSYVVLGHSEKRAQGETNYIINKKVLTTLKAKITPILCIGENVRDNNGEYLSFIKHQIQECLEGISKTQIKDIVIAYEPIWAIGENAIRVATPSEFLEMQIFIKKIISDLYSSTIAHNTLIIYGGSVHPENAKSFVADNLTKGSACGFLVGRDSLSPKKFGAIINSLK